jgi:hypothetical protein
MVMGVPIDEVSSEVVSEAWTLVITAFTSAFGAVMQDETRASLG